MRDRVAIQRGSIVYCLEGIDNPGKPEPVLAAQPQLAGSFDPGLLGGVVRITGVTEGGAKLEAVPYYAWDNRPACDPAQDWMTVWVRRAGSEKARRVLDQDDRKYWQHSLYRPVPE